MPHPPTMGIGLEKPLVLVAVAVVVVASSAALVGLFTSRAEQKIEVTATLPSGREIGPSEDPSLVWGRSWTIETLNLDGEPIEVSDHVRHPDAEFSTPGINLRSEGHAELVACNVQSGPALLEDGRFVIAGEWFATTALCGDALSVLEHRMYDFLLAGPLIHVKGERLTLTSGEDVAVLTEHRP